MRKRTKTLTLNSGGGSAFLLIYRTLCIAMFYLLQDTNERRTRQGERENEKKKRRAVKFTRGVEQ